MENIVTWLLYEFNSAIKDGAMTENQVASSYRLGKADAYAVVIAKVAENLSTGRWTSKYPIADGWYWVHHTDGEFMDFIAELYNGTFTYCGRKWTPCFPVVYSKCEIPLLP